MHTSLRDSLFAVNNKGELRVSSTSRFGERLDRLASRSIGVFSANEPEIVGVSGVASAVVAKKAGYYQTLSVKLMEAMAMVLCEDAYGIKD